MKKSVSTYLEYITSVHIVVVVSALMSLFVSVSSPVDARGFRNGEHRREPVWGGFLRVLLWLPPTVLNHNFLISHVVRAWVVCGMCLTHINIRKISEVSHVT